MNEENSSKGSAPGPRAPYGEVADDTVFKRPGMAETSRGWGMVRNRLAAVTPASPSHQRICDVVEASAGVKLSTGAREDRCNPSQQLWMAAREANHRKVERLLFGEEGVLVTWLPNEGRWLVRMSSDSSEKTVPPIQIMSDGIQSLSRPSSKSTPSDWSRSSVCLGQRRSNSDLTLCPGSSPALSAADAAGAPTPAPGGVRGQLPPPAPMPEVDGLSRCASASAASVASSAHAGYSPNEDCASTVASFGGCKGSACNLAKGMQVRVLDATSLQVRVDWEMHQDKSEALIYKNRRFTCQALHAAVAPLLAAPAAEDLGEELAAAEAVRREGVLKIVRLLLQANANPSATAKGPAKSASDHRPSREVQAIHMAAGVGDEQLIRLLVSYGADPQAQAKNNGEPYYTPLHDAVWFDARLAARTLVELHANVDSKNMKGETPLHLAAHLGHVEMVAALLLLDDGRELLRRTCNKGRTPLDVALQSTRFPPRKLYLFTHKMNTRDKAEAFLKVAQTCPMVAPELLFDDSVAPDGFTERAISKAWRDHLQDAAEKDKVITAEHLANLVEVAPLAAIELVDALTAEPLVEDSKHHPLPFRANVPLAGEACRLSCAYVPDSKWRWYTEKETAPAWHKRLAPENPKHGQEVEIKILKLPGVLNLDLMHVLAVTPEQIIFAKLAIHAVLRCAWDRTRWIHSIELLVKCAAMICMVLWVLCPDGLGRLGERFLWCVVSAEATSECLLILFMSWRCLSLLGVRKWCQWSTRFVLRTVLAAMNLALAVEISGTMRPQPGDMLFASSALLHWVYFLWELRTFRETGKRLLPMMRALMLLGGMLVVLLFLTIAFAHAFWAMAGHTLAVWDLFSVLKLLFTGEVDEGIDPIGITAPDDQKVFLCILANGAIVVFLVCFVNLFIAVLSDNYQVEQEKLIFTLFQERAHVCCNLFLAPKAGGHWVSTALALGWRERCVVAVGLAASVAGLVTWIGLVCFMLDAELSGFIAVAVAVCGILALQAFVRGWLTCDFNTDCHLWVCHDKFFEEGKLLVTEDVDSSTEVQGRIARLRSYIHDQIKLVGMSMKLSKNLLLKRHKDHERLLGQIFAQLEEIRSHTLGAPAALEPASPLTRLSQTGRAQGASSRGGVFRRVSRTPGPFAVENSELRRRRNLREIAQAAPNTPGRTPFGGLARGGEGAGGEAGGSVQEAAARWPLPRVEDVRMRTEEDARSLQEDPVRQTTTVEAAARLNEGLQSDPQLESQQDAEEEAPKAEDQSTCGDEAALGDLREELRSLRAELQQRDGAVQDLREEVQALHADLRGQWGRGEELQRAAETVQTLRQDIEGLRSDVQQQRAEGRELRRLVEQVLLRFDGAVAAAATGQEILRQLPQELRPRREAPETQPTDID